jgi:hypothetical protein
MDGQMNYRRKPLAWVALLAGTLLLGGCGTRRAQRFIPSEESAERTLKTALTAWQNGKRPPSLIQETTPAVHLVDTNFKPGQKLARFTVLGPTTGDAQRCYAVRLTFDDPPEEVRARFVVMGLDPLWVVRYEDFERMCHWAMPDHTTEPKKPPT